MSKKPNKDIDKVKCNECTCNKCQKCPDCCDICNLCGYAQPHKCQNH